MTITMYDAIDVNQIPGNAPAVAGYVGGNWPTYSSLVSKFPHARHLSIAISASEDADCLDIEAGDAVPSQAPAWVKRQIARGVHRPVVYASLSEMESVRAALNAAGISRADYRIWTAHFTGVPHIEPGSDGTQWTDHALGRNLDQSLLVDDFFTRPQPPVQNTTHYERFDTGPFNIGKYKDLNEREVVEQYDGARQHPIAYALYLKFSLRPKLQALADRVAYEAIHNPQGNKPSWGQFYRGWRFQQLIHRAQGQRFV